MWRRRGSIGGGSQRNSESTGGLSSSLTALFGGDSRDRVNSNAVSRFVFDVEVPTPGPLGLDLRARYVERDKPQRGAIVKGFRPLSDGRSGFLEACGRIHAGDVLQTMHQTFIDDLPFDQIVAHAAALQKDPSAWPLRLEFCRESWIEPSTSSSDDVRPRRSSFFRSSIITPSQDSSFNEKLQYFRGFFASRIPTGGAAPKTREVVPPMPSCEIVDKRYRKLLVKRGVPDDVTDELVRIEPFDNKWNIVWYAEQHENEEQGQTNVNEAARLAENLIELKWDGRGLRELDVLRTKISRASSEWIEAFLSSFGLEHLTMKLPDPSPYAVESSKFERSIRICETILRILRSLTQFTAGVEAITRVPGLVKRIALCFHTDNGDLKKHTLQLLGIICYNSAAGHQAVVEAFNHYRDVKGERIRFSCLRDALKSTRYSFAFKEDVLSFVNIIVNKAISLEERLAIRADFLALQMAKYFEEIRTKSQSVQKNNFPDHFPEHTLLDDSQLRSFKEARSRANSAAPEALDISVDVESRLEDSFHRSRNVPCSPELRPKRFSPPSKSAPSSPRGRTSSYDDWEVSSVSSRLSVTSIDDRPYNAERTTSERYSINGPPTMISSSVTQLRNQLDNMEKQIEVFERFMEDDRKDTIFETTDLSSIDSVFNSLSKSVAGDVELEACFLSILQQLLFIPKNRVIGKEMWSLSEHLMKQVGLLSPVEEVRNFELGYEDRKALLRMRDKYTAFLQKCADEDPTFKFQMDPIILIENRKPEDLSLDEDIDEDSDTPTEVIAREHPDLLKYFKLLQMGMPLSHVELKLRSEIPDMDVTILERPDQTIALVKNEPASVQGVRADEHEKYAKYFKLSKMGMPLEHIQLKMETDGLNPQILQSPDLLLDEEGNEWQDSDDAGKPAGIPAKDHKKFLKYFRLLKMGMPAEQVHVKMTSDGLAPAILDTPDVLLDADGNPIAGEEAFGIPAKDHEKYAKFFKLLAMGMPVGHIKLKISSEGLDPNILDTPDVMLMENGSVFVGTTIEPAGIPAREHEKYAKFFKLMSMGMPAEQVKLKASAEGLNPKILDTPDILLTEEGSIFATKQVGIIAKEHEMYAKYFKLQKMGMPLEQIKLKMSSDGLDIAILDAPDALLDIDGKLLSTDTVGTPASQHEHYAKFFKLLKMGMPSEQIKLKMSSENLDASILDTPAVMLDADGHVLKESGIAVRDHELFAKFFKLMKMGMPIEQVRLKASSEGLDANLLDTPDVMADKEGKVIKGKEVIVSEHPSYSKYFKLMKMGMPRPQIELKMKAEGLDSTLLDSPDSMIPENIAEKAATVAPQIPIKPLPPKPKLRNLYWEAVKDNGASGTIWDEVATAPSSLESAESMPPSPTAQSPPSATADTVINEFVGQLSTIFVTKAPKSKSTKKVAPKRRAPTRVALIDVKRANNIGIMLARFRVPYSSIRDAVMQVDKEVLSAERLSSLLQFVPEETELEAVRNYKGDPKLLGDAEQYFYELLPVPRVATRLQAMQASYLFDSYVEEQEQLMNSVRDACAELRQCERLREIFRVVLSLGNALNDGTARGGAKGFRLGILLKLNQVKACDNSTTLLHFVAKALRAKDPPILRFNEELPSIESASRVTMQVLKAGEGAVSKAASLICTELEEHAKLLKIQSEKEEGDGEGEGQATPEPVVDRFQDEIGPLAQRARGTAERIQSQLEDMVKEFEETVTFYGEDPASLDVGPDSFFSIFYSFSKVLQTADRDNERKRIAEERRIRREEATKKRLELLKRKKKNTSFAALKDGDVDDIMEKIRAKRVAEKRQVLLETLHEVNSTRSRTSSRASNHLSRGEPVVAKQTVEVV